IDAAPAAAQTETGFDAGRVAPRVQADRQSAVIVDVRFACERENSVDQVPIPAKGRYCCKSLFALVIKNSPGCRRDFRVKMWRTSLPEDKHTGDLGNVIEAIEIAHRCPAGLIAGKLSPDNFGLLQQYLPGAD